MVSIIVPLYFNRLELYQVIGNCLNSIIQCQDDFELLVVDDGSPLDTSDFEGFADIWLRQENAGYTSAVNAGFAAASGDILVVANDDLIFTQELLDRFNGIKKAGIYSPKTTDEGSGDYFGSIWGMNRITFQDMGKLKPELKHFFSDKEYYDRAKRLGVPIVKWEDIVIEHLGGETYKGVNKSELYKQDHETYLNLDGTAS